MLTIPTWLLLNACAELAIHSCTCTVGMSGKWHVVFGIWYLEFYRYHGKLTACGSVGTAGMCARLFAKRGMGRHGTRYVRLCACGGMLEVIPV